MSTDTPAIARGISFVTSMLPSAATVIPHVAQQIPLPYRELQMGE